MRSSGESHTKASSRRAEIPEMRQIYKERQHILVDCPAITSLAERELVVAFREEMKEINRVKERMQLQSLLFRINLLISPWFHGRNTANPVPRLAHTAPASGSISMYQIILVLFFDHVICIVKSFRASQQSANRSDDAACNAVIRELPSAEKISSSQIVRDSAEFCSCKDER